ncbi:MAG: hypothetical protein K2Q45_04640 [Nitrosomonas sp.]|nr:hypothetical protein [Nitrosomonas sp.]
MKKIAVSILLSGFLAQTAIADVCDHRPSQLIGGTTSAVAGSAGTVAATGVGMKAAGIYTLTNATTGAAMLGSTAAGASAAGTTGIIAGSAGFLGTAGVVLMSPFVIIPATVAAVGIIAYEGGCYLSDK